ncbi:PLC-like phosphodiesterase [Lipomyces oligophaga]|uniref:PLC-like phosphodiesterase n=1 Tax=Lipomyces oligophaga TaxID=45792 RepID=UPI0034CEDD2E
MDLRLSKPLINTCFTLESDLEIVHGDFPASLTAPVKLSAVLQDIFEFLTAHPTESIVLSMKHEGPFSYEATDLANILLSSSCPTYFETLHRDQWFLEPRIPTLGEIRGKIVLFRRFSCDSEDIPRLGIPASWTYNTTGETSVSLLEVPMLAVQDYSELQSRADIPLKIEYIIQHVNRAAADVNENTLYLNFTTGSNLWYLACWPRRVAKHTRTPVADVFPGASGKCGIVILDFPELDRWNLVKLIIERNSQFQS